jgi:hypothetical protein
MEVVKGEVWNGKEIEIHFWNSLEVSGKTYYIDLTWQQFPAGSAVRAHKILDRNSFGDGESTVKRCELLLQRVKRYLEK